MFPRHGASPLNPADARELRLPLTSTLSPGALASHLPIGHHDHHHHHPDNHNTSSTRRGQGGRGGAAAAAAPQARAVASGACAVGQGLLGVARGLGLAYGGLWLLLAGYRAVKRRLLRRALREVVPALQRAGVTFWLDFGTLMSLARNNDVYEHDNDIDMVLLNPDFAEVKEQLSRPGVLPRGYTVEWAGKSRPLGGGLTQDWLRVYLPGKVMWADLFGGFEAPGGADLIRINKNSHCDVPRHLVLPLGSIRMLDSPQPAPAPRDVAGVLLHRYGPEWTVPKYASKGKDTVEHNKRYLRLLRALGRIGLRVQQRCRPLVSQQHLHHMGGMGGPGRFGMGGMYGGGGMYGSGERGWGGAGRARVHEVVDEEEEEEEEEEEDEEEAPPELVVD
ncbi:hypothetical protein HYH02_012980 [Chlamydomonas schloesseri]|uniref:Uncharacterized protein n=1 Tax=Chlamydomonas schloesseri TaxID=2026947 RepID=A0A835T231_9CHLO|nr:hypothetical protein HYH02_012980 [Chlamydomonas schloesseri]|eukprot:KAG2432409.1 hypothetical protein HYH02_012980 [Chlamydomonas schloesseri]